MAEDLQWADEASLLVWLRLSRAVGQLPLLVVGSLRSVPVREEVERLRRGVAARGGVVMELGPLPGPEAAELAAGYVSRSSRHLSRQTIRSADHGDGFVDLGALGGAEAGDIAFDPGD